MAKHLRIRRPALGAVEAPPSASGKRGDVEGPIHRSILAWLRLAMPGAEIHHSPNSIGLSGDMIQRQIARDRAMGTIKGWPDLTCVLPGPQLLFLEVKAKGNYPDADQKALHARLQALGCKVAVVRSIEDAAAALNSWGIRTALGGTPTRSNEASS